MTAPLALVTDQDAAYEPDDAFQRAQVRSLAADYPWLRFSVARQPVPGAICAHTAAGMRVRLDADRLRRGLAVAR